MTAPAAIWRLGPSPSAVRGRIQGGERVGVVDRRRGKTSVRALKDLDDGGRSTSSNGGRSGELSRRAFVALVALSAQLGGAASARILSVAEKNRLEMLRSNQQQRKNEGREAQTPANTGGDAPASVEASPIEPLASAPVGTGGGVLKEGPKPLHGDGAGAAELTSPPESAGGTQMLSQAASEVSAGGSNGFGLLSVGGVLGTGVAGALYYRQQQSKTQAESALETANMKLKEADVAMASLRKSSEGQLLAEKEQARKAANMAQEQRTKLGNELLASRNLVTELEGQLITEKASAADLEKEISRLLATLADQGKKYGSLNERFVEETRVGEQLRAEISRLQSSLADQEKSYSFLNERLVEEKAAGEQIRKEIQRLNEHIEAKENEIGVQNRRIQEEKDSVAKLQAQLQNAEANLADEKAAVVTLQDRLQTAQTQLADERNNLRNLESGYASSQDRNQKLESSINELKQNLKATTSSKDELEKEVRSLSETINMVEVTLAEEREKKETLNVQLKETAGALEKATAEVRSLELRLADTSAAKETLEEEKNAEISNLTRKLQDKSSSLDDILKTNQTLSDEITALRSRQADLNEELENTQLDLEASHNEIRTISDQLTVAVNLSLKLETQLNETRTAYQTTHAALVEERKVTAAAKNQLAMSQRSLIAEKNSVKALRGSVDQALQALQELNQDSVALADELDKAKKHIANLESESASVRQKLVKEKEASAQLRASSAQAESNIAKLVKENDGASKKLKQLEGELLKGKGEIARQKGKLLEQKRALQQAETRLKMIPQVRAEAALLVEKYEDLVYQEKEQKDALIRQIRFNEKLLKSGKNVGADLADVKQSLDDGKAARSEMETALGELQEAVADNSS